MNSVISVIVPVYNVATYLAECIDSVLNQDHHHLEVILIDDGSTDESGKICDKYAQQDSRIKVIHQHNCGAAEAKNAGLRAATGEYLSFVDGDDFLELNAYSHMLQLLQDNKADVVQCSYRDVFREHTTEHQLSEDETIMIATDFLVLFTKDWTCALLWNKLYKRSLFDGIIFETGHKIDDEYFTYRGIMNAEVIVRDNRIVYNYRKRASSIMFSPISAQQIVSDRIDYLSKRRKNVIARFPMLRPEYDSHFLEMMIILSRDANATAESIRVIRQNLKSYFREKKHSKPDFRLLPALAWIMFGSTKHLLRCRKQTRLVCNLETFFE